MTTTHDRIIATRTRVQSYDRAAASDDDLLQLVYDRAPGGAESFDGHEPFIARVVASNTQLDSHGTYMDRSTLNRFAENAAEGVAVMDSHRTGGFFSAPSLNFGRSLTGEVKKVGDRYEFRSAFYTVPGLTVDGRSTDDYVLGIRTGVFSDISVGFSLGPDAMIECSICGNDMMDYAACSHFPGQSYEVEGRGRQMAVGKIINATLREYSLVYEGATPGAGVVKAERMIEEGQIDHGRLAGMEVARLERLYNRSFELPTRVHALGAVPTKERSAMEDEDKVTTNAKGEGTAEDVAAVRTELEELRRQVREAGKTAGLRGSPPPDVTLEELVQLVADLRADADEANRTIEGMRQEAEDGRLYRKHLTDDAVKMAARAVPQERRENFSEDRIRRMLAHMSLDDIRDYRDDQKEIGDKLFPAGRQSRVEGDDDGSDDQYVPDGDTALYAYID